MKRIPDDLRAKATTLQMAMVQATLANDRTTADQLNREYEELMVRIEEATFGKRRRNPLTIIERAVKNGVFTEFGGDRVPWQASRLCLCDAIYHGECQMWNGPSTVTSLSACDDAGDDSRIAMVLLRGERLAEHKKLVHIGSVSADSGSLLIIDAPISDQQTSSAFKQAIRSAPGSAPISALSVADTTGWLVSPMFGSGGFDIYAKADLIVIDFLRLRDDPERMRY